MAITAQQIITRAYRTVAAVSSGDDPTVDELADGLDALNDFVYNLSEDGVSVPWLVTDYFTLSPGQLTYQVGPALPGAPASETRPIQIIEAWVLDGLAGADPYNNDLQTYPFEIISSREYAAIGLKKDTTRPSRGWYQYGEPNGTLVIDSNPDQSYTLVIQSQKDINPFGALSTASSMPPSYNRMLRFNLAVEIGSELGAPMDPRVIKIADDSLSSIKSANAARTVRNLVTDDALLNRGRYDISGDQY